jgi:uncharacterized membrane protein
MATDRPPGLATSTPRTVTRWLLGTTLLAAGLGHLTWLRQEFQAQVPSWFPVEADLVVVASGVVEIVLGTGLVVLPRYRVVLGWVTAAFFVVIVPGNVAQYVEGTDAFGLTSDAARAARLAFQPLLVAVAVWSTGAWAAWRSHRSPGEDRPGSAVRE